MVINLILVGIVCLGIEAIVPGLGFFGLAGLISLLAALYFFLGANATAASVVALIIILFILVGYYCICMFPDSWLGKNLSLKLRFTADKGYVGTPVKDDLLHATGVVHTILRPAGTVKIGDRLVDAVSEGTFIQVGTTVQVIQVEGSRVVVRAIEG